MRAGYQSGAVESRIAEKNRVYVTKVLSVSNPYTQGMQQWSIITDIV